MTVVHFEPLDTLFFRDGRPYNQGELSQSGVVGMFPPAPTTLVGAVRAGCARTMGWSGGNWTREICERLGDGADLGPSSFRGPVLMRGEQTLFPAPAHLMGLTGGSAPDDESNPASLTLLSPGTKMSCDLGSNVPLPAVDDGPEGISALHEKGWWITSQGLEAVLRGRPPRAEDLLHRRELWAPEPRVGIARCETTRVASQGAMYSPIHIRLKTGVRLALEVHGLPGDCLDDLGARPQPVGGEARTCWLSPSDGHLRLPASPDGLAPGDPLRYCAVVLTPADTGRAPRPGEQNYAGLPGRVVSACLPRPTVFGGWDSRTNKPLALRPHLAPGSVLFLESEPRAAAEIWARPGTAIGDRTDWGFGLIAIGHCKNGLD